MGWGSRDGQCNRIAAVESPAARRDRNTQVTEDEIFTALTGRLLPGKGPGQLKGTQQMKEQSRTEASGQHPDPVPVRVLHLQ